MRGSCSHNAPHLSFTPLVRAQWRWVWPASNVAALGATRCPSGQTQPEGNLQSISQSPKEGGAGHWHSRSSRRHGGCSRSVPPSFAPPSAYQRPGGAKGVMTKHIAEVIAPAPFTTRWTILFDLGPESCGVNADGSEPSWTLGQDARDPGRGTVYPWMLDIVRRAEIPEPARAALLAAAE